MKTLLRRLFGAVLVFGTPLGIVYGIWGNTGLVFMGGAVLFVALVICVCYIIGLGLYLMMGDNLP